MFWYLPMFFYISIHVISIDLLCKVKKLNFQIQFLQEIHMDDYCRHFKVKWLSKCQYLVVQTNYLLSMVLDSSYGSYLRK